MTKSARVREVELTAATSICYFPNARWFKLDFVRAKGFGWRLYLGRVCLMNYRSAIKRNTP